MDLLYAARAVGGLLTITTLLGMLVAQFVYPQLHLKPSTIQLMVLLIGGLLGIDMLLERTPVSIQIGKPDKGDEK